jgi:hypothetical protein
LLLLLLLLLLLPSYFHFLETPPFNFCELGTD